MVSCFLCSFRHVVSKDAVARFSGRRLPAAPCRASLHSRGRGERCEFRKGKLQIRRELVASCRFCGTKIGKFDSFDGYCSVCFDRTRGILSGPSLENTAAEEIGRITGTAEEEELAGPATDGPIAIEYGGEVARPMSPGATDPAPVDSEAKSEFTGSAVDFFFRVILAAIVAVITLGIALPWVFVSLFKWEAANTVIGGRRMAFDGTGMQLFGRWLLWCLLSVVTFGIFALVLPVYVMRWKISHTHFSNS